LVTLSTKPYYIIENEHFKYYIKERRVFENYRPEELFWHRDTENRIITLVEGECQIQKDNSLPINIDNGSIVFIEKMKYHRLLTKNTSRLVIDVYKFK